LPIVSISITSHLLQRFDRFMRERGYSSRSEAIRDAIRDTLSEYNLGKLEQGAVTATVTVISERERHDVDQRLMRLRHEYNDIISGNMHIHLGSEYCLEIFITEGDVDQVLVFIGRIRAMRGIQQVKFTMVPLTTAS
jgi:CopG family nickel-responsive transcriptional regulator